MFPELTENFLVLEYLEKVVKYINTLLYSVVQTHTTNMLIVFVCLSCFIWP